MRYLDVVPAAPGAFRADGAEIAWKSIPQGAATSVLLAVSPLVEGVTGRYFEDCVEAGPAVPGVRRGVAAHALDPEKAAEIILNGVREERWRILVGSDAEVMDREVRATPEEAYTEAFFTEKIAPASPGFQAMLEMRKQG